MLKACLLVSVSILPGFAADPVRSAELAEHQAKAVVSDQKAKMAADAEAAAFHAKFNKMLEAMRAFTSEYNESQGQAWPARRAAELDQAMREMQKSPMWKQYAAAKFTPPAPGKNKH